MKGILVREFGSPEVCRYETDIPIPEPNDNQVRFRMNKNNPCIFILLNESFLFELDSD